MTAAVTNLKEIPDSRQLNVPLERKTARLILNIQSFNDQFDANTTKVNHIRIASKASTDTGETSTIDIKPLQKGEGGIGTTYTALVIPGEVDGKLYFTTDEATETPLVVKTGALEAGKSYTYNLIVGKNKVTIGGVTVAEWGPDKIDGGKAEYYPYVTFTADAKQTFKITTKDYSIPNLEYSVNNGKWATVEADTEVTFGGTNGDLRLRGTNINGTASLWNKYSTITFTDKTVKVACTGDIRTLLNWKSYSTVDTQNARFCYLFKDCAVLTSAPELPATTLSDFCYDGMFYGCTSLTAAPELKATTLEYSCYSNMFSGCTSLTAAPELKATTLEYSCYSNMFSGCISLTSAPELPATTLVYSCYDSMFNGCTSLTSAPELPATTLENYCYYGMFYGCTSLTAAPELPATELANNCYNRMFKGCTSLTAAPKLKATTLAKYCYYDMFSGCTKLSTVTMLAPSDQISNWCDNWLDNAGTDPTVKSRTLIVNDEAAYNKLVNVGVLPSDYWQKENCTVKAADGTDIK